MVAGNEKKNKIRSGPVSQCANLPAIIPNIRDTVAEHTAFAENLKCARHGNFCPIRPQVLRSYQIKTESRKEVTEL